MRQAQRSAHQSDDRKQSESNIHTLHILYIVCHCVQHVFFSSLFCVLTFLFRRIVLDDVESERENLKNEDRKPMPKTYA